MTTREANQLIGQSGMLALDGFKFEVEILDVRDTRFGHIDYYVRPLAGSGERWVEDRRVTDIAPLEHN